MKPFVGQTVSYHPKRNELGDNRVSTFNKGDQPFAALVTYVHPNGRVNLSIFDHNGGTYSRPMVEFVQPGHTAPGNDVWCEATRPDMQSDAEKKMMDDGMPQTAARIKAAEGKIGDNRDATEGEPQRGDPANPDPRVLPTVEHVAADPQARANLGLPVDETDAEKKQHEDAENPTEGVSPEQTANTEKVDQITDAEFEQAFDEEEQNKSEAENPAESKSTSRRKSRVNPDLVKK